MEEKGKKSLKIENAEEFGGYLKSLRKKAGLTLTELGDKIGFSNPYLSQIENGKKGIPSPEMMKKLSEALDTPYDDLMILAGYINNDENTRLENLQKAIFNLTNEELFLTKNYNELTEKISSLEEHRRQIEIQIKFAQYRKQQMSIEIEKILNVSENRGIRLELTNEHAIVYKNGVVVTGKDREEIIKKFVESTRK